MVKNRSIYYNVYALLHMKVKGWFCFLFLIVLFLYFLFLFAFQELSFFKEYTAIYSCDEDCHLIFYILKEDLLTAEENYYIAKEKVHVKKVEMGPLKVLEDNKTIVQEVILEIDRLNYVDKESLTLKLETKKEAYIKLLMKTMKGGG